MVLLSLPTVAACLPGGPEAKRLTSWPENPCAVLTAEEVTAATGVTVVKLRRAPSIAKIVNATGTGGDPGPGKYICVYETTTENADITIIIPPEAQRTAGAYWAARQEYFRTYPGSARPITDLGQDAWLAGGAVLYVLARRDMHFAVTSRMYQPGSDHVLIALARAVLART
jgi:hypothetical protein